MTRGAVRRDHVPPADPPRPDPDHDHARRRTWPALAQRLAKGIAVTTQPDIRWGRCDIKTVQLLPNVLAKQAARKAGAFEAWLVDDDGFVTEGASTNAWIVDEDGNVVTRDLSQRHPARRHPPHHAGGRGRGAAARWWSANSPWRRPRRAREAFISSATGAAVPVVAIDGQTIGDGTPGPADPPHSDALCRARPAPKNA